MNKRRHTRSPRLLYLTLAAMVLGPTAPPLAAQGTGKRVIELRGTETLGIGTSPSKAATAKVGQNLLALYAEYQAHLKDTSGQAAAAPALQVQQCDRARRGRIRRHRCHGIRRRRGPCRRSARARRRERHGVRTHGLGPPAHHRDPGAPGSRLPAIRPSRLRDHERRRGNESGGPRDARGHPWSPGRCSAWRAPISRAIHNLKCLSRHSAVK